MSKVEPFFRSSSSASHTFFLCQRGCKCEEGKLTRWTRRRRRCLQVYDTLQNRKNVPPGRLDRAIWTRDKLLVYICVPPGLGKKVFFFCLLGKAFLPFHSLSNFLHKRDLSDVMLNRNRWHMLTTICTEGRPSEPCS